MMLYGLYFTACLIASPDTCEKRVHLFSDEVQGPMACIAVAQPQLADWQNKHPDYRVTEWRCGQPPRDKGTRV